MLPFSSRLLTINSNPPKRVGVLGSLAFSAWVTSTGNVWGKDRQSKLWHSSLLLFSWTPKFLSTLHIFWTSRETQGLREWPQTWLRGSQDAEQGLCVLTHSSSYCCFPTISLARAQIKTSLFCSLACAQPIFYKLLCIWPHTFR